MPVEGNTQPYGLLHGGASCVLAETLGSVGSALHGGPDRFTVGIEINATHHRAAAAGYVTGVATQVHAGQTLATYEIVISDDRGRRICTARLSCLLRAAIPGGPKAISETLKKAARSDGAASASQAPAGSGSAAPGTADAAEAAGTG